MAQAHIFQINISKGGVPKLPIPQVKINTLGIEGDEHHNQAVHGGPMRALCIYSLERILALQKEGHPIYPGATGENLVITGLDWGEVTPGVILHLGNDVEVEITHYTEPCPKITNAFASGDIMRMGQRQHPGWSRVYARILQTGSLKVGDIVELLTP
jgi:MOSC domain-containing protein YiiM